MHRIFIFYETLIVTTEGDEKEDTCHVLEAMYPFATFRLLATNIEHMHIVRPKLKYCFSDARCPCA